MGKTYRKTSTYRIQKGESSDIRQRDGAYTKATRSCENNNGCPYCLSNRTYKNRKRELSSLKE